MSQAIYYISQNHIDQNLLNQNGTALSGCIPSQAVNIPVGDVLNKATLLKHLADACDFPSYFSANWDSAWDCLTDSAVTHLTLNLTAVEQINTEDFDVFQRIIEDAYKNFGKPQLWVIMPPADNV